MKTIKPDLLCSSIAMALLLCAGNAAAQQAPATAAPAAANDETVHSLDQLWPWVCAPLGCLGG